jgi:hypothetical protein
MSALNSGERAEHGRGVRGVLIANRGEVAPRAVRVRRALAEDRFLGRRADG